MVSHKEHTNELLEKLLAESGMDDVRVQGILYCLQRIIRREMMMLLDPIQGILRDAQGQAIVALQSVNIFKQLLINKGLIEAKEYDELAEDMMDKYKRVQDTISSEASDEDKVLMITEILDGDEDQAVKIVEAACGES